jgi:hypothetical protein
MFADLLDGEINSGLIDLGDIANHMHTIISYEKDECCAGERRNALREWMIRIIERYLLTSRGENEVREHAAYLANCER